MKPSIIFPLGLALAFLQCPAMSAEQTVLKTSSRFRAKEYSCVVKQDALNTVPKWEEGVEWPALSPKRAMLSATNAVQGLIPSVTHWTVATISLRRVGDTGNWVYVVEVTPAIPAGKRIGHSETIEVVVLLDGSAIKPSATE